MGRTYWSACYLKRTYRTKRSAKRAARQAVTQMGGRRMFAYHCPWCLRLHVGHRGGGM